MDTPPIPEFKKKAVEEGAIIVYEDEASFHQSPTLHRTWAPLSQQPKIPTKGQRNTQKVYGAVGLYQPKFVFKHQEEYFNHTNYITFLDKHVLPEFYRRNHRVFYIQDNASYHKKAETYEWFKDHRKYIEVFCLPPYFPQLNAVEPIWKYVRKNATHNRYFDTKEELCVSLLRTLNTIRKEPKNILGILAPFC